MTVCTCMYIVQVHAPVYVVVFVQVELCELLSLVDFKVVNYLESLYQNQTSENNHCYVGVSHMGVFCYCVVSIVRWSILTMFFKVGAMLMMHSFCNASIAATQFTR